jgi:hypothetical protein
VALLAEELVEEWLNRQGYFTIRGIRLGVHEIDVLAVRPSRKGLECRQVEVQVSMRPVSYITRVPVEIQEKSRRAATSSKLRSDDELRQGIREWIAKKYDHKEKVRVRGLLAPRPWTRELVVHVVKHPRELELIEDAGITVLLLRNIVQDLKRGGMMLEGAVGAHLSDLVALAEEVDQIAERGRAVP